MTCKICGAKAQVAFEALILNQFSERLYQCEHCGFLSVDKAHWLPLAYQEAINKSDTGIVARNLMLYKVVTCVASVFFGFAAKSNAARGGAALY